MYSYLFGGLKHSAPKPKPVFSALLAKAQKEVEPEPTGTQGKTDALGHMHFEAGHADADGHKGGQFAPKDATGGAAPAPLMSTITSPEDLIAHHKEKLESSAKLLKQYLKEDGGKQTDTNAKTLAGNIANHVDALMDLGGMSKEELAKGLSTQGLSMWLKKKHGLPLTAQEEKNIASTMKSAIALQNKKQAAKKMEDHKKNSALAEEAKAKFGEDSAQYKKLKSKAEKDLNKAMSYGVLPADAAKEKEVVQEDHTSEKIAQLKAIQQAAEALAHHEHVGTQNSGDYDAVTDAIAAAKYVDENEANKAVESGQDNHAAKVANGKSLLSLAVIAHAQVQHHQTLAKDSQEYKDYKTAANSYKYHYNDGAMKAGLNKEDLKEAVKQGKQAFAAMKNSKNMEKVVPPAVPEMETLATKPLFADTPVPAPKPAIEVAPEIVAEPDKEAYKKDFIKALAYVKANPQDKKASTDLAASHKEINDTFGAGTTLAWLKDFNSKDKPADSVITPEKKQFFKDLQLMKEGGFSTPGALQSLKDEVDKKQGVGVGNVWTNELIEANAKQAKAKEDLTKILDTYNSMPKEALAAALGSSEVKDKVKGLFFDALGHPEINPINGADVKKLMDAVDSVYSPILKIVANAWLGEFVDLHKKKDPEDPYAKAQAELAEAVKDPYTTAWAGYDAFAKALGDHDVSPLPSDVKNAMMKTVDNTFGAGTGAAWLGDYYNAKSAEKKEAAKQAYFKAIDDAPLEGTDKDKLIAMATAINAKYGKGTSNDWVSEKMKLIAAGKDAAVQTKDKKAALVAAATQAEANPTDQSLYSKFVNLKLSIDNEFGSKTALGWLKDDAKEKYFKAIDNSPDSPTGGADPVLMQMQKDNDQKYGDGTTKAWILEKVKVDAAAEASVKENVKASYLSILSLATAEDGHENALAEMHKNIDAKYGAGTATDWMTENIKAIGQAANKYVYGQKAYGINSVKADAVAAIKVPTLEAGYSAFLEAVVGRGKNYIDAATGKSNAGLDYLTSESTAAEPSPDDAHPKFSDFAKDVAVGMLAKAQEKAEAKSFSKLKAEAEKQFADLKKDVDKYLGQGASADLLDAYDEAKAAHKKDFFIKMAAVQDGKANAENAIDFGTHIGKVDELFGKDTSSQWAAEFHASNKVTKPDPEAEDKKKYINSYIANLTPEHKPIEKAMNAKYGAATVKVWVDAFYADEKILQGKNQDYLDNPSPEAVAALSSTTKTIDAVYGNGTAKYMLTGYKPDVLGSKPQPTQEDKDYLLAASDTLAATGATVEDAADYAKKVNNFNSLYGEGAASAYIKEAKNLKIPNDMDVSGANGTTPLAWKEIIKDNYDSATTSGVFKVNPNDEYPQLSNVDKSYGTGMHQYWLTQHIESLNKDAKPAATKYPKDVTDDTTGEKKYHYDHLAYMYDAAKQASKDQYTNALADYELAEAKVDSIYGYGAAEKWMSYHLGGTYVHPVGSAATAPAAPVDPKAVKAATAKMKKSVLAAAKALIANPTSPEHATKFSNVLSEADAKYGSGTALKWVGAANKKEAKANVGSAIALSMPKELGDVIAAGDVTSQASKTQVPNLPDVLPTDKTEAEALNAQLGTAYYMIRHENGGDKNAPDVLASYKVWDTLKDHMKANLGYDKSFFSTSSSELNSNAQSLWNSTGSTFEAKKTKATSDYVDSVAAWSAEAAKKNVDPDAEDYLKDMMVTNAKQAVIAGVPSNTIGTLFESGKSNSDKLVKKQKEDAAKEISAASHDYFVKSGLKGEDDPETKAANLNALNIMAKHKMLLSESEQVAAFGRSKGGAEKTIANMKLLGDMGAVVAKYDSGEINCIWCPKDSEAYEKVKEVGEALWNSFTPKQKEAFVSYTGSGHSSANKSLASGSGNTLAKTLSEAMDGQSLGVDMKLRRNMPQKWFWKAMGLPYSDNRSEMNSLTDEQLLSCVGKVYREPALSSASYDENNTTAVTSTGDESGYANLRIRAAKDISQGAWLDYHSGCPSEREILMNKGATYLIRGIERDDNNYQFPYKIDMDLIGYTEEPKK